MRQTFASLCAAVTMILTPSLGIAKGETVRIVISGGDLAAPIEIAGPSASPFQVWSNLNIDWSRETAKPSEGLRVYDLAFVTTRTGRSTYVVRYAIDPTTKHGYVYLPGASDPAYKDNVWMIYRGTEGNWLHASSEWEKLVNPLIAKAAKRN